MRTELDGKCETANGMCATNCERLSQVKNLIGREMSSLINDGSLQADSYKWLAIGLAGLSNNFGQPGEHTCQIPPDDRLCVHRMSAGINEIDRFRTYFSPMRYLQSEAD